MTIKRLLAVVLGTRPRGVTHVPITPEFGVKLTLRAGDKLVRRNARGEVEVQVISRGGERSA
jgi:hypothetical protein